LARAIGKFVRRSRDGLGWSQANLAEQFETSVEFVSMLERGALATTDRRTCAAFRATFARS